MRHRDDALNAVDALNIKFHVKGRRRRSNACKSSIEVIKRPSNTSAPTSHRAPGIACSSTPRFSDGRSNDGIHVELMRRLRKAEKWLLAHPLYRRMSPVEIGEAMNIDEDHHGGRPKNNNSMHTLGLAVDIRYLKNPWVTSQRDNEGKLNTKRNGFPGGQSQRLAAAWWNRRNVDTAVVAQPRLGPGHDDGIGVPRDPAASNEPSGLSVSAERSRVFEDDDRASASGASIPSV